jgi:hypothetical protein
VLFELATEWRTKPRVFWPYGERDHGNCGAAALEHVKRQVYASGVNNVLGLARDASPTKCDERKNAQGAVLA